MTLGNLAVSSGTVNSLLLYANIYSIYGVAYKQFAIAKGQNANRSRVITFAVTDHQLSLSTVTPGADKTIIIPFDVKKLLPKLLGNKAACLQTNL